MELFDQLGVYVFFTNGSTLTQRLIPEYVLEPNAHAFDYLLKHAGIINRVILGCISAFTFALAQPGEMLGFCCLRVNADLAWKRRLLIGANSLIEHSPFA